jgi:acetate kinase
MPDTTILVLNSGSSSIKFSLFRASEQEQVKLFEGAVDGIGTDQGKFWIKDAENNKLRDETPALPNREVAFRLVADALSHPPFPYPDAIGHRTVAGGPNFVTHRRLTPGLIEELDRHIAFAPLHLPIAIYIMRKAQELFPNVPNFAVLDTAFHRTIPEVASRFAIPDAFTKQGIHRFGFHGISYESIVYQLGSAVPPRLIVAHLGNGASITAIRNGESVDTSMGLTPTGGLISGSRTGDIDPGVLLYMLRDMAHRIHNTTDAATELEGVVAKKSGLLGVSKVSNDMRELRDKIASGSADSRLAVDLFIYSIRKFIGSYVAVLGGLDMLVFTGGIGQNDADTRREVCEPLAALGIKLDAERNKTREAAVVSADDSAVQVRVMAPAEDLMIVRHTLRLLRG